MEVKYIATAVTCYEEPSTSASTEAPDLDGPQRRGPGDRRFVFRGYSSRRPHKRGVRGAQNEVVENDGSTDESVSYYESISDK